MNYFLACITTFIFLASPKVLAVDLEAIATLPENDDSEVVEANSDGEIPEASPSEEILGEGQKCKIVFDGPGYVSADKPNQKFLAYKVIYKGKTLASGQREIQEKTIYADMEKKARKEFPKDKSDQKTVILKYVEPRCKTGEQDKDSSDYAFAILSCMSKIYEKDLRSNIKSQELAKLKDCN